MNLYLVEIEGLGIFSVVAYNRSQCKKLVEKESQKLDADSLMSYLDGIDRAIEKAQWFSLNTAVNWDAGITHFYLLFSR